MNMCTTNELALAIVDTAEQDPLVLDFIHEIENCIIRHDFHKDVGKLVEELNLLISPALQSHL